MACPILIVDAPPMSDPLSRDTPQWLVGIDSGGTFTDFLVVDLASGALRLHKVLSTPHAPEQAILSGLEELGLSGTGGRIVHGTTVATNAVLEDQGSRVAWITNQGLGDVINIGRQARQELYNLQPQQRPQPVSADCIIEVDARRDACGEIIRPLTEADLAALEQAVADSGADSVAINLLFSWLDDDEERRIEARLHERWFVSRSSFVLPEHGEFERGMATWLNARLGPLLHRYLDRLSRDVAPATLSVMQSNGLSMAADLAARRTVNLLLSGPAGGLAAARWLGEKADVRQLLTFDMGGTSTDVALVDGEIRLTREARVGPWPVSVPMADIHTIGAGGGSIAWRDEGGALRVGPASAGADPGPACYGRGGRQPTVTDAHLVLGRLPGSVRLAGQLALDGQAAESCIDTLAAQLDLDRMQTAQGIIDVANANMARALRRVSLERGIDPGGFTLLSFGGAGGLHVCELAEAMGMCRAMVPAFGGVLSAFGMLVAAPGRQLTRSLRVEIEAGQPGLVERLRHEVRALEQEAREELHREGIRQVTTSSGANLRYRGQSATLPVPVGELQQMIDRFEQAHEQRFGHRLSRPVELVSVWTGARGEPAAVDLDGQIDEAAPGGHDTRIHGIDAAVPVMSRDDCGEEGLNGPAVIVDAVATTLVSPGWQARKDALRNLWLTRSQD